MSILFKNVISQCIFFVSFLIFSSSAMALDVQSPLWPAWESDWSVLTNEELTIRGLSIGMSYKDVKKLFPQVASKTATTYRYAEMTRDWAMNGDTDVLLAKSDVTCIGASPKEKCTKISLMERSPTAVGFTFVGDKLSSVKLLFIKIDDDPFYVELKKAYAAKFKSEPKDRIEDEQNGFSSITICRWVNIIQNVMIFLEDIIPSSRDPYFKVSYESTDFRNIISSRIDAYNVKAKEVAAAKEKKDADRKKGDL